MSLEAFFETEPTRVWGNPVELEVWRRIRLSVAAYAYEYLDESIMSDAEFDKMCLEVDLKIDTGNKKMDNFFKKHFDPSTGQWIRKHPELKKIADRYARYYKK
jgi:hypothetical protein